jgi:riboflavin kinase/FMN adenylyltransferase
LTPGDYRCKFVKKPCFFYELDKIKKLSCIGFAEFLKNEFKSLEKITVGYDFRFGYKRLCGIDDLRKFFVVEVVGEVKVDGISVHSGVIREFLKNGEIKKANTLLGRAYSIQGTVIKGQGIGKKELVPTINLSVCDFLLPKNGVYASKILINDEIKNSITFIGIRETTDGCFSVETYVFDEDIKNIPNDTELFFYEKIRDNRKFDSLEELKKQIENDIKIARKLLDFS